jgi:hypothetical protein
MIAKFGKTNRRSALAVALFAALGFVTLTDAQPAQSAATKDLAGAWVLDGEPGAVAEAPAKSISLKFFADGHWNVTHADPKTGVVTYHHGGTFTLKGNDYLETVEYANESTSAL